MLKEPLIQLPIHVKSIRKIRDTSTYLNIIKAIYSTPIAIIKLHFQWLSDLISPDGTLLSSLSSSFSPVLPGTSSQGPATPRG